MNKRLEQIMNKPIVELTGGELDALPMPERRYALNHRAWVRNHLPADHPERKMLEASAS